MLVRNRYRSLRWSYLIAGLLLSFCFVAMPADGGSDTVNNIHKFVVGSVLWTGVVKWCLSRIPTWWKGRRATA